MITGLAPAGAELMLYRLADHMSRDAFDVRVIALGTDGPVGAMLREAGIPVVTLDMSASRPSLRALLRLRRELARADVVQSWMYHADLMAGLARATLVRRGRPALAWGIRQSNLHPQHSRRLTRAIARTCAALSSILPTTIVCCSESVRVVHETLGYDASKMRVIPNGFDVNRFAPVREGRAAMRQALGLPADAALVGMIGRFDPQKDHATFFRAATRIAAARPDAHFVLCGIGITPDNATLADLAVQAGVADRTSMLGSRPDIADIVATLDVLASTSAYGEGFPNVLAEAMATGVPCVATDVGDSAPIIGDTGLIVPIGDHDRLADGVLRILALPPQEWTSLGDRARMRVSAYFSLGTVVERYETMYRGLAAASVVPTRA